MRRIQIFLLSIFAWLFVTSTHAQVSVTSGLLPKISLSYGLPKGFKVAHSIESRQKFYGKSPNTQGVFAHNNLLTDFTTNLSKSTSANSNMGIGYTLRIKDGELYHRALQQFSWTKKHETFSLENRMIADQTFGPNNSLQLRLRYRASLKVPLSDKSDNSNEFYLKLGNEYLGIINNNQSNDLEIRLVPQLGYEFNPRLKVEFGLDGRINQLFEKTPSLSLWMSFGFYVSLSS